MRHATATRVLFAALAIAFFTTPVAARIAGVTAEEIENRRFAQPPKPSQGWDAFQQATQYLVDRMPLRAQAIRANTRIWTDLFGTDPRYTREDSLADDHALPFAGTTEREDDAAGAGLGDGLEEPASARTGRAGWFYVDTEFEYACDTAPNRPILERWGRLLRAIRESGRKAVMLVPPAKASVYPEYLPDEYPYDHCALEGKERFWRLLAEDGPDLGVLELRSELVRLKEYAGDGLFQRKDSHWSTLGAMTMVKAALGAVGDGVRLDPSEIVDRGMVPYKGDLTIVRGRFESDERREYAIERAPGAPRVPGRTLLICDSFAGKWLRLLRPYFEHLRMATFSGSGGTETIAAIRRSDTVIVESMEAFWKADYAREVLAELRWTPLG
jgi:alginate O-acetyltransferase complex protein AlgJ